MPDRGVGFTRLTSYNETAMDTIYLDHNATTPPLPEVLEAMAECEREAPANPASQHRAGRKARQRLEDAREGIAEILGARPGTPGDQLIFTSGGTEANNLALFGLLPEVLPGESPRHRGRVAVSAIEHPSVSEAADYLKRQGWPVARLGVDRHGVLKLEDVQRWLAGDAAAEEADPSPQSISTQGVESTSVARNVPPVWLISVMLGNNETGVLQPVAEVVAAVRRRLEYCQAAAGGSTPSSSHETDKAYDRRQNSHSGRLPQAAPPKILVHIDAVQVVGKLPVNFTELGVDALTFSGHKFHGPKGIGGLIVRQGVELRPRQFGGFQQAGKRPGTETVSLAVGMHVALQNWQREANARAQRLADLRDRFEAGLRAAGLNIVVHGSGAARLPHTSNISFLGHNRQSLLIALDLAGIACSTGSACASGSTDPSPTLLAMGVEEADWESALRFSFGCFTEPAQVAEAVRRISKVVKDLEKQHPQQNLPHITRS